MLVEPGGILGEPEKNVGRTWRESWENLRRMLVEPGGKLWRIWGELMGEPEESPVRT